MSRDSVLENTIKVRLEIELPPGHDAPLTIMIGERASMIKDMAAGVPRDSSGVTIQPSDPALVKVVGSGISGNICANGVVTPSPTLGTCTVIALLVQAPESTVDDTPPSEAVFAIPDENGAWENSAVPGAVCAWPGTGVIRPLNALVVWERWQNIPNWVHNIAYFHGECADRTDCDPKPELVNQLAGQVALNAPEARVIDTTPAAWNVSVNGFRGEGVTSFNGNWTLTQFLQTAPGNLAWVAGGDSVQQPRVELFGQACGCTPFELRFSYQGSVVSYRFARDSWNPIGINQSGSVISSGLASAIEIPGQVQLSPG